LRNHYVVHRDLEFLKANRGKMQLMYKVEGVIGAVGGAIFVSTDKFRLSGMDNEAFYGWGLEDGERHYRWLSFDFNIYRSKGYIFHLTHARDSNWLSSSKSHHRKSRHDIDEIVNYSKEELKTNHTLHTYLPELIKLEKVKKNTSDLKQAYSELKKKILEADPKLKDRILVYKSPSYDYAWFEGKASFFGHKYFCKYFKTENWYKSKGYNTYKDYKKALAKGGYC
jgi:hypothetical protein